MRMLSLVAWAQECHKRQRLLAKLQLKKIKIKMSKTKVKVVVHNNNI